MLIALTFIYVAAHAGAVHRLTDADLLTADARPYDKASKMGTHEVLGVYHGLQVVVDYPCSDLCPLYTSRVIHYSLRSGVDCEKAGGKIEYRRGRRRVPAPSETFCVPGILTQDDQ
jgi:hypothetical protein